MKQLLWPMPVCFNKDISLQRPTADLPANGVSHFPGHGASIVIDRLIRFLHSASKVSCCLTAASRETKLHQCRSRSEEHTSELQSLMRISYAVLCLKNTNSIDLPLR